MPLVNAGYPDPNPNWTSNGKVLIPETLDRRHTTNDETAVLTTQVMLSAAISLPTGTVVNKIGFITGATAGATMTNWWVALYSSAATPALIAQSADQTSGAIAASTAIEVSLATAQTITASGTYYVALMVKATTVPSLVFKTLPVAAISTGRTGQSILVQTSGSALTATAPATIATPTTTTKIPYMYVV